MSAVNLGGASSSPQEIASYSGSISGTVNKAVSDIKSRLSEKWNDWDVSGSDLKEINDILSSLNPEDKNQVIARLPDEALKKWGDEIGGWGNGLSMDDRTNLFKSLAKDLNAEQLSRVYGSLGESQQNELGNAINQHAGKSTQVEFISYVQQDILQNNGGDTEGLTTQQIELMLDLSQLSLDIVGLADPTPVSDGVNGVISLLRGDYLGAGISALSMIPYIGDAAKLGKLGEWAETIANVADMAAKNADFAKQAKPVLDKINAAIAAIPDSVVCTLPESAQSSLKSIQSKIDDVSRSRKGDTLDDGIPEEIKNPVATKKAYSDPARRPKYAEGQVEKVWDNARQPDGNVYDPNTGELLVWDKNTSRSGQWDMGHLPGHEYRKLHKDYMDGKISKEEFLEKYRDPENYRPESPSENRSHRHEVE